MEITKLLDIKDRRAYASLRLLECLTEVRIYIVFTRGVTFSYF
jgi:hypothetical protein